MSNSILGRRVRKYNHRRLPKLMKAQDNLCYWCKRPMLQGTQQNESSAIRHTCDYLYILEDGGEVAYCRATVDHVKPIIDGGRNEEGNLVASCSSCNRSRTATPMQDLNGMSFVCPDCGKRKKRTRKKCQRCTLTDTAVYMALNPDRFNRLYPGHQRKIRKVWEKWDDREFVQ